jgi:hypothetical protein
MGIGVDDCSNAQRATRIQEHIAEHMRDTAAMERHHGRAARYLRSAPDALQAQQLVADVLGDMAIGRVACDISEPLENPLETQITNELRRRVRRLRREPKLVPFTASTTPRATLQGRGAAPEDPAPWAVFVGDVSAFMNQLRVRAASDGPVLQLVDLYGRGFFRLADARRAGMSAPTYQAACARLVGHAKAIASGIGPLDVASAAAPLRARTHRVARGARVRRMPRSTRRSA